MGRLACIEFPQLPLQLALRREPVSGPLAVVREDKPSAPLVFLNKAAAEQGLKVGMRYSEALAIVSSLRGVTVSPQELDGVRQQIRDELSRWSPVVEESTFDPGCFWLAASGLSGLYGTETEWGKAVRQALRRQRLRAAVVVGSTRAGTWVLARVRGRSSVVGSAVVEQQALEDAPVGVFSVGARHRRLLERLGIRTLSQLLSFPETEVARRFGPELLREVRCLQQLDRLPLQQPPASDPWTVSRRLGFPWQDRETLAPLLLELVLPGLEVLARKGRLLAELRLVLVLESHELVSEIIRPAQPTTQMKLLKRLLELRLSQGSPLGAVIEVRATLVDVASPPHTGELFAAAAPRSLEAGEQALALLRAKLGNASVVHPVLADSHVPELSFQWRETMRLKRPVPLDAGPGENSAVRRVFRLPPRAAVPGQRLAGPLLLQTLAVLPPLDREEWYLRNPRQEVQWVSLDRQTRGTTLLGMVD